MSSQKQKWKSEILHNNPHVDEYFVDLIIDLYERDAEKFKKLVKKHQKTKPEPIKEPIKEIIGAVDVVKNPDEDFINKYFKAPIHIKDDKVDVN